MIRTKGGVALAAFGIMLSGGRGKLSGTTPDQEGTIISTRVCEKQWPAPFPHLFSTY